MANNNGARDKKNGRFKQYHKYSTIINKRLYGIWRLMMRRCYDKRNTSFARYGNIGIKVCNEWHNFDVFCEWALNNGYCDNLQIDRINNNGGYEPSNCRWVTPRENSINRRSTTFYTYNGIRSSLKELVRIFGKAPYRTIHNRIKRLNWDVKKAIETPQRRM